MLFDRLQEGGPFFMYPLAIIFILVMILIVKGLLSRGRDKKTNELISSITLFAIVWGFLGQIIGLIGAFDAIESYGNVSAEVMAAGLKVAFLPPVFGMFIFLIGRLGLIIITWIRKE
ncbi:MotA/TolQ/ExbB proton channel family protein [Lutimonas saemankumensis]|uniref:MotA/TolQ/ExbB proton channel family protein n=1 Tax=Lutimonas saemankumensis TaxID=483016 RepID=UPI001CD5443D|nr:MotA/TolQ/ExbB proton channel family protein [Lutimonas saemankumensis]MCA0932748.1 MotA/TolQ/ExbB proton channel family protein [Lutimonas saemankumensis]